MRPALTKTAAIALYRAQTAHTWHELVVEWVGSRLIIGSTGSSWLATGPTLDGV